MYEFYLFGGPVRACRYVMEGAQRAIRYLERLSAGQAPTPATQRALDDWLAALSALETEAGAALLRCQQGRIDPADLTRLLHGADRLLAAFRRYARQPAGPLPEPAIPTKEVPEMEYNPVPIGGHQLPPLPYPYDALEPYIDEKTMRLHHTRHHLSYVDGLNKAEREMARARETGNYDLIRHWEREAAFNGAGHYLHTIFWNIMNPRGGGQPTGALAEQIRRDFGSFERFRQHFSSAANKVEAVGWAILVWAPRAQRLEILTAEKHQNLSQWDVIPLLVLDVWEHAYYLKHQNNREAYIEDWWNVVNWPEVARRYEQARTLTWQPF